MDSGTRTNIDNMITLSHDVFIMFDNYNRIPYLRKSLQIGDEHIVITWMETD